MSWVGVIIGGIIIGLLGKFVAPGSRDNTPLWLTIVCGVVGVLIASSNCFWVIGAVTPSSVGVWAPHPVNAVATATVAATRASAVLLCLRM